MKATEAKLLGFFKKLPPFVIPIYQRTYSWGERKRVRPRIVTALSVVQFG